MSVSSQSHDTQERGTPVIGFKLLGEDGQPVASAAMTTMTLTLYDARTNAILNSRNAQNVLNANNVTMHATSGVVTWSIQIADQPIQNSKLDVEQHIGLFLFTWSSGTKAWAHQVILNVANIRRSP